MRANWRDVERLGCPHHVLDLVQAHRPMLAIDHDEVVSDRSEQLDQIRRMPADDGAEHHLALAELRFRRIGAHGSPVRYVVQAIDCTMSARGMMDPLAAAVQTTITPARSRR